ncbi:MAG: DUF5995 family protein [Bacteroidota bacterium]
MMAAEQSMRHLLEPLDAQIAEFAQKDSPLGYFAVVYRLANQHVVDALAEGAFDAPDQVAAFMTGFCKTYVGLMGQVPAEQLPKPWQVCMRAAKRDRISIQQHIALSLNARVNFDLPIVLAATFSAQEIVGFRADFAQVNHILFSTFKRIHDQVGDIQRGRGHTFQLPVRQATNILHRPMLQVLGHLFQLQRRFAYQNAVDLAQLDDEAKQKRIRGLEKWVRKISRNICTPDPVSHMFFRQMKAAEIGTTGQKIAELDNINARTTPLVSNAPSN